MDKEITYESDIKNIIQYMNKKMSLNILDNKNILITGATGLIGGGIVDLLVQYNKNNKYHIYAGCRNLTKGKKRFENYLKIPTFHLLEIDVTHPIIHDIDFHYIIYAASNANPYYYATDPVGTMRSNIIGVDNILSYGIKHKLSHFHYISSSEVYGEINTNCISEEKNGYIDSLKVRSCYANAKRAAETLSISYSEQYDIKTTISRPCHIYGPFFSENDNRAFADFLRRACSDKDLILKSKGDQYRSWCYVLDCCVAILTIILCGKNQNAYNIANPHANITIFELAQIIARISQRKIIFEIPDTPQEKGFSMKSKSDYSIAKISNLGWTPLISLEDGLKSSFNTLKEIQNANKANV